MTLGAFDILAARYDEVWTPPRLDGAQRAGGLGLATRLRYSDPATGSRSRLRTGEARTSFGSSGIRVRGVDQSAEMVRIARERGVHARVLPSKRIDELDGRFDGVISNFGRPELRLLSRFSSEAFSPARSRTGGHLANPASSDYCVGDRMVSDHGQARKALRRWSGRSYSRPMGIPAYDPSARAVLTAFDPDSELSSLGPGICLFVPPSYVGAHRAGSSPGLKRLTGSSDISRS